MNVVWALSALALVFAGSPPLSAAPSPKARIAGMWKTECKPIGKNGRHGFITRLEVKGRALTATTQIYAHNNCDIPTVRTIYRGTMTVVAEGPDGAIDFDHIVKAITMTPDHEEVVTAYNGGGQSGCGYGGGWTLGVARGVEGRYCAPFTFPVAGTKLYERAWVSGNELRIGSFPVVWTNIAPDKRPTAPGLMVFRRAAS